MWDRELLFSELSMGKPHVEYNNYEYRGRKINCFIVISKQNQKYSSSTTI